jgi:hypothetical protein
MSELADGGAPGPRRTRVVLRDAAARVPGPAAAEAELAQGTPVGEALVKGLVRAQLALAVRLSLVVAAGLGTLPLLFAVAPAVAHVTVLGAPLPWLLLGVLSFPFLVLVGWAYVRWAERNEQDFEAVVAGPRQ